MKRIPNLDYEISEDGKTLTQISTGKTVKYHTNKYGYLIATLFEPRVSKNGKSTRDKVSVHKLVSLAYNTNNDSLPQINHIDGNKLNNHYTNLEWCTAKHNINHAYSTGLFDSARKSSSDRMKSKPKTYFQEARKKANKLTDEQVYDIRNRYNSTMQTRQELANEYNMSLDFIYRVGTKRAYTYLV